MGKNKGTGTAKLMAAAGAFLFTIKRFASP